MDDSSEAFKILKGLENLNSNKFFTIAQGLSTRGHSMKLYKSQCRLDLRKFFFSQRVVNEWNRLPQYVVNKETVLQFKIALEKFYKE